VTLAPIGFFPNPKFGVAARRAGAWLVGEPDVEVGVDGVALLGPVLLGTTGDVGAGVGVSVEEVPVVGAPLLVGAEDGAVVDGAALVDAAVAERGLLGTSVLAVAPLGAALVVAASGTDGSACANGATTRARVKPDAPAPTIFLLNMRAGNRRLWRPGNTNSLRRDSAQETSRRFVILPPGAPHVKPTRHPHSSGGSVPGAGR
jgi:hypothetical protein